MKQQDIAIVIIVVFFASIISFVVTNKFVAPSSKKLTAETVKAITSDFPVPDSKIFNSEAINPTKLIEIAPNTNDQPFADND